MGSFCYEILKSMLHSYDTSHEETDETHSKSKSLLNGNKLSNNNSSSSEESDEEDNEINGLEINKHNGNSGSKLEKDLVLNSKYPQLTKNIFI